MLFSVWVAGLALASSAGLALASSAAPPPTRFEVTSLPGWEGALPSKQFTGYLDAGTPPSGVGTMYFHYWLIEAEKNPSTAPVLIWYNGGPGASSLFGMLNEWGPLQLNENSLRTPAFNATGVPTPQLNPFRWTKEYTVVAIDSPPPIGLSFCTEQGPSSTNGSACGPWKDSTVFAANHKAHVALFTTVFPELKSNPLYFIGESYAGIYVPGFADAMMKDPVPGLNFQGFAVGDGWTGCEKIEGKPNDWCVDLDNVGVFKYPNVYPGPFYDIELFHGHSQFSNQLYREIQTTCSEAELRGSGGTKMSSNCSSLIDEMAAQVGGWFPYNMYNSCPVGSMQQSTGGGDRHGANHALRARRNMVAGARAATGAFPNDSGVSSPCLGTAMAQWFQLNQTLSAIGAPPDAAFINLDNGHGFSYTSDAPFVGDIYERAIAAGLNVLVYEGDNDPCGLGTSPVEDIFVKLFDQLFGGQTKKWRPWTTDGQQHMAGYVVEWAPKTRFVSIRGSGHLAPLNRPEVVLSMLEHFTVPKELPGYNKV